MSYFLPSFFNQALCMRIQRHLRLEQD